MHSLVCEMVTIALTVLYDTVKILASSTTFYKKRDTFYVTAKAS